MDGAGGATGYHYLPSRGVLEFAFVSIPSPTGFVTDARPSSHGHHAPFHLFSLRPSLG